MTTMPQTAGNFFLGNAEMRGPLLDAGTGAGASATVELMHATPVMVPEPADPLASLAKIHVVRTGWTMHLIGAALFAALLIPTTVIALSLIHI